MNEAACPSCGDTITIKGTPKIGMHVTCKSCDTEVEVVWLDPLELDWPTDEFEGEDAIDDFDEEEEEG